MRTGRRPSFRAATLGAALALCAGLARAGDEPLDPQAATARIRAAFPAPDPKYAFSFDGELSLSGAVLGTSHVAAEVDSYEGKPAWKLTEEISLAPAAMKSLMRVTAWVTADLRLLREDYFERQGVHPDETGTLVRTEKGLVRRKAGADPASPPAPSRPAPPSLPSLPPLLVEDADDLTSATTAGLLLFLRMCPAEPARYALTYVKEATRRAKPVAIEVKGPSKMPPGLPRGETWLATWTSGSETTEACLDPSTRAPRLIRMTSGAFSGVFAPKGVMPAPAPLDFSKPPGTAKEAALRFIVASASKDVDLLAAVVHWPTLHANAVEGGYAGDEATFKKTTIEKLSAKGDPSMRALIEAQGKASMIMAGEEAAPGDLTVVTVGPPLPASVPRLVTRAFDGVWFVTAVLAR